MPLRAGARLANKMSYKSKGSSLPPLEDSSLSGRSPGQRRRKTSYEYKSGSSSPNTPSPRSPFSDKDSPRQKNSDISASPRGQGKEINKEFRTLCIGSPIPDTDPHADDMEVALAAEKRGRQARNRGHRAPSITIDKVEELHLVDSKSPRGRRPISPASYELIEHTRSTTPFSKSKNNDRLLSIEPSTPPVERKGNRQVINYYRGKDGEVNRSGSDGNITESSSRDADKYRGESRKHTRSQTEGSRSEHSRLRDKSPSRRDLTPSPRLTRRARENEQTFSSNAEEREHRQQERQSEKARQRKYRENDDRAPSPSPRDRQRHRQHSSGSEVDDLSPRSPRDEIKKPVRLEPLNLRARTK